MTRHPWPARFHVASFQAQAAFRCNEMRKPVPVCFDRLCRGQEDLRPLMPREPGTECPGNREGAPNMLGTRLRHCSYYLIGKRVPHVDRRIR